MIVQLLICIFCLLSGEGSAAPPVIDKATKNQPRNVKSTETGTKISYNIGANFCIEPDLPPSIKQLVVLRCPIVDWRTPVSSRRWFMNGIFIADDALTFAYYKAEIDEDFFITGNKALLMPGMIFPPPIRAFNPGRLILNLALVNMTHPALAPPGVTESNFRELAFEEFLGTYECRVSNHQGEDTATSVVTRCESFNITITDDQFVVGRQAVLTCEADSRWSDKIEWLSGGVVVASAESVQELQLVFDTVNDTLHGSEYTCVVTIGGSSQQETHVISVTVPPHPVSTSISISGCPLVGSEFTLTCTVNASGFTSLPDVTWMGADSEPVTSDEDVTITTAQTENAAMATLTFKSLTVSDEGKYTCTGSLASPLLENSEVTMDQYNLLLVKVLQGAPRSVTSFCSVVVWQPPSKNYEVVTGYEIRFFTNMGENVILKDGDEFFHAVQLNDIPFGTGETHVQVRARYEHVVGSYSPLVPMNC